MEHPLVSLIDRLVEFVRSNNADGAVADQSLTSDQIEQVAELSAQIAAHCRILGIVAPRQIAESEHVSLFGFTQIPYYSFVEDSTMQFMVTEQWKQAMRELRAEAVLRASERQADTKHAPKKKYRRPVSVEAADCARHYKKRKRADPSATMKSVVADYVEETGAKKTAKSILRTINDHPELWKE